MTAGPRDAVLPRRVAPSVRVGVIGAGAIGADHATTLQREVSGATVEVVAHPDLRRAQSAVTTAPGARTTGDAYALVDDPAVDAVVIAPARRDARRPRGRRPPGREAGAVREAAGPDAGRVPARRTRRARGGGRRGSALISLGFVRRFDPG